MPSRAPARRLVVGGFVALAAIVGAVAWPLVADPNNPNPADLAEHEKAQELLAAQDRAPSRHGPSDKDLGALREKLEKKIKVDFTDVSTLEVMNKLLREAGIPFVIDNLTLLEGDGKVTLVAPAMSIRDALSQACDSFTHERGDWCVANGAVVVSSARQVAVRTSTTRHYDIRHLLVQMPNFTNAPSLDLNQSLSNTSSGGSGDGAAEALTLFADEEPDRDFRTREEIREQICTMIQDTVGEQAEWQAYGGELSSLRELGGKLTVRTSARNHEHLTELLDGLAESMHETVYVEARAMLVKTSLIDQIKTDNGGDLIFDARETDALLKKLGEDKSVRRVAMGRYMMRNGQRAYMAATLDRTFLSDVEPVSGTGGGDPTLSLARNGMVIDAAVSSDPRGNVTMTLRAEVSTGGVAGSSIIPIGPGYPAPDGDKPKDDMPACGEDDAEAAPPKASAPPKRAATKAAEVVTKVAAPAAPPAHPIADSATLSTPSHDIFRVNTGLTIPGNGAAVFSGSSKEQASIGEDMELIVIVRAKASGDVAKRSAVKAKPKTK